MAKRPDTWMPLYIGDYLRKTMHLTIDQHGAYLMLIMACWCDGGTLPGDDRHLASICHVPIRRWQKLRPAIERFFQVDEAGWHNARVTEELAKAEHITQHRRNAGRASARAREATLVEQMSPTLVEQMPPTSVEQMCRPSPSPKDEVREETNINNLTSLLVAAREESENFKKFEVSPSGRSAPLVAHKKRDQLVQKLLRFSHATFAEPELSAAIGGLSGADPEHSDQWWLDHVDKLMRAQHWDDTERLSA